MFRFKVEPERRPSVDLRRPSSSLIFTDKRADVLAGQAESSFAQFCQIFPWSAAVWSSVLLFLSVVHPSIFANKRDNMEAQLTATVCYELFLSSILRIAVRQG